MTLGTDVLFPGDHVTIVFRGPTNPPPSHQEQIAEDGMITLPLIGSVKAAFKNRGDLASEIHDLYVPDYYRRLTVTVTVGDRFVAVAGQVRTPGMVPLRGELTLLKAIAAAGDFTNFADRKNVRVTRSTGETFEVNAQTALEDPQYDVAMFPGDKVNVPMRFY